MQSAKVEALTKCGSAPAKLVDEDEGVWVGVLQDDRRLGQLDEKGGLAVKHVVRGSDPGEYPIHRAERHADGRDPTPHLPQDGQKSRLSHQRRLSA